MEFLESYCSGELPFPFPSDTITFNLLYEAEGDSVLFPEAISQYAFLATSTWLVIDQEGKIAFREDDNISPEMIDIVKGEIDELLYP